MSNTQNFRVKHGLEVTEAATFSNTVTATGNVFVSNASLNVYTFGSGAAAESLRTTAANATHSTSIVVNTAVAQVSGNLTVTGITRLTATDALQLGTGNVVLFSTITGSQAPVGNVNLIVNRGSSSNVSIFWDEANDLWKFTNDGTKTLPLTSYSGLDE